MLLLLLGALAQQNTPRTPVHPQRHSLRPPPSIWHHTNKICDCGSCRVLRTDRCTELLDGFRAHLYADDTQIYLSVSVADARKAARRFGDCVTDIDRWMNCNRLKLNADKTQVIWVGTRQQLVKLADTDVMLQSTVVHSSPTVIDLGVHIDDQLTMSDHVAHLSRTCFFQLRQIRAIRQSLTTDATKTLVHAFVSSRLDYCNSLLNNISDSLLNKLQRIQNAAARLVSGRRKFDHITPVLRELHWLPVWQRVTFKIATLVFKCLHEQAPSYLARQCIRVASLPGRSHLRSADRNELDIPRTHTVWIGARPFSVSGPVVWNSLPNELRDDGLSLPNFRWGLKTHLFGQAWLLCHWGTSVLERRSQMQCLLRIYWHTDR